MNLKKDKNQFNKYAVLVTGGSGYVGSKLVTELAQNDQPVVALYRHRLPITHENLFPVCSDLSSKDLLSAPLRGVETVVHLAWDRSLVGPEEKINLETYTTQKLTPNLNCLKNLIEAMEKAETKRMIFISALGANSHSSESYLREKYFAENMVLNSSIPEKTIIRPSVIYGGEKYDRFYETIKRVMKLPGFYPLPKNQTLLEPVYVSAFVQSVIQVIKKDFVKQANVMEMVGDDKMTMKEILKIISENCFKASKIPINAYLGESLISLIERDKQSDRVVPKLKNYLALGRNPKHMESESSQSNVWKISQLQKVEGERTFQAVVKRTFGV